jgi:hypothetical protein
MSMALGEASADSAFRERDPLFSGRAGVLGLGADDPVGGVLLDDVRAPAGYVDYYAATTYTFLGIPADLGSAAADDIDGRCLAISSASISWISKYCGPFQVFARSSANHRRCGARAGHGSCTPGGRTPRTLLKRQGA